MRGKRVAQTILALVLASPALAEEALDGGAPVMGDDPLTSLRLSETRQGAAETVASPERKGKALRLTTRQRPASIYAVQVTAATKADVKRGDALLATFYVRALETTGESAEARTEFVFERRGGDYQKSATYGVRITSEWKRHWVRFASLNDYAAGAAQVCFRMGYDPQVIELAEFQVLNYGKRVALKELPQTPATYPGQDPDAPWRRRALERIETNRKGDLVVTVVDGRGRPVSDAKVEAKMTRQAFHFGSAINVRFLTGNPNASGLERYKAEIPKLFNQITLENALKFGAWESDLRPKTMEVLEWAKGQGLTIRGHCLIWPSWRNLSTKARALRDDPKALREYLRAHAVEEASATKDYIAFWDVINEPFSNHDVMDLLGKEVMVEWFKAAREAAPNAQLFINDYGILSGGGRDSRHQDHYYETIQYLLDNGAPLDGVGVQCHFGGSITPPERVLEVLDRFAKFGKPIHVTEFDNKIADEQSERDATRDFLIATYSHPSVECVTMWGFWDSRHWKRSAPIYDRDWNLKPGGKVWIDLTREQWRTVDPGKTDAQGRAKLRGHLGDYEIVASLNGRTGEAKATLTRDGAAARIALD